MANFDKVEEKQLVAAFEGIDGEAGPQALADFVAAILMLNASQRAALLPAVDTPKDDERWLRLDSVAALLIARRKALLDIEGLLPSGVVYLETDMVLNQAQYYVAGLINYLTRNGAEESFLGRVRQRNAVRLYAASFNDGYKLETLAASLLGRMVEVCYATQRTFDQGVDCFASDQILEIESWCCNGEMLSKVSNAGHKLHVIASCKANLSNALAGPPDTIPPAHVRELIGSWVIQRSAAGLWHRRAGIKPLSPLQLLLVTTYRLSDGSLSLCRELGVAVWGLPEIVYLICRFAPDVVFEAGRGYTFDPAEADKWISTAEIERAGIAAVEVSLA
jgi:hypothetical protein